MEQKKYILECKEIFKSFGTNKVLQDINIGFKKGEVHALLGQNGAGKSTLVKIITGVYDFDKGQILIAGKEAVLKSPKNSEEQGIVIIHQDQQLVPYFDVTRNAFLGSEIKGKGGLLNFKKMKKQVDEKLNMIQADFTSDRQISSLSVGQREQVAIISALLRNPEVLILDEPTASLSNKEIEKLFEIIELLKKEEVTIIYISHHLEEIFRITDRLTILRDSHMQGTFETKEISQSKIVSLMIGRELKDFYPKEEVNIKEEVLRVDDLHSGKMVNGVDFQLHRGEILGFAGLVGAGRTETMLAMYGAEKVDSGSISIAGKAYTPKTPKHGCASGIAFIPEDRRNEGIVAEMSVVENLSLATTDKWAKRKIISRALEKKYSNSIIHILDLICTGAEQEVRELSGGNQQKVVIGRWLIGDFDVFVFDQPTTGVDIGAKTEIYRQMIQLAKKGCGIIFISSENEELLGICDRIAVMVKGKIVKTFVSKQAEEHDLFYWSAGEAEEVRNQGVHKNGEAG